MRKTKRNQFRADFRATLMRGGICGVDPGQFWAVLASCGVGRVSIGTNITRNTSVEHPHNEEIPIWSTTMYHASKALRHLLDVNHLGHNQLKFSRSPIQSFASNGGRTDPFPMSMEASVAHVISASFSPSCAKVYMDPGHRFTIDVCSFRQRNLILLLKKDFRKQKFQRRFRCVAAT